MVDGMRCAEWLSKLVQIPSVGPGNASPRAGVANEARIAAQLAAWFKQFGGEVTIAEVFPNRPNVYAIWRNDSARWIAVDVHVDTVGVETMQGDPFDGRIADGRVYGRGSVDTKASLGVLLALLEEAHTRGKRFNANVIVCASADEETGGQGAIDFAKWIRKQGIQLDELLVAEPTMCAPVYGHKGGVGIEFEVVGVAAHSSQPELGQNAIAAAATLINALVAEHERLQSLPPTSELGQPKLTVSLISGGQAMNIVPNVCKLYVDRRTVVGEDLPQVAQALHVYAQAHCPLPVKMRITHQVGSFYQAPTGSWIKQLAEWSGAQPHVVAYGTNAFAYDELARECVVLGPGSIEQAHRDVEWVTIAELEKAAGIYARWLG